MNCTTLVTYIHRNWAPKSGQMPEKKWLNAVLEGVKRKFISFLLFHALRSDKTASNDRTMPNVDSKKVKSGNIQRQMCHKCSSSRALQSLWCARALVKVVRSSRVLIMTIKRQKAHRNYAQSTSNCRKCINLHICRPRVGALHLTQTL